MDITSILVAVITGLFAIVGNWILSKDTQKKDAIERAKGQQLVDDRLKAIEQKLDLHNGYAEKFGDIQTDIAVIKTELKNLKEDK